MVAESATGKAAETRYSTPAISLLWVLRLRWGAAIGQALTIAVAGLGLGVELPFAPLATVVAFTLLSNLGLWFWVRKGRSVGAETVAFTLAADTLSLAALLYVTGGAENPFSVLFLVQITIAALVLSAPYTIALVAFSLACYALLFATKVPVPDMVEMRHGGNIAVHRHLEGMFAAFALASVLIGYFVTQLRNALRERDTALANTRKHAQESERIAALSTLAAGAAHELGTPLMTIAVAAKELVRECETHAVAGSVREDAALILDEAERCRDIVQQMRVGAGGASGEAPEETSTDAVVAALMHRLGAHRAARVHVRTYGDLPVRLPKRGLVQALVSLLDNAIEASGAAPAPVVLDVEPLGGRIAFQVTDHGRGMAAEELTRVGEPFFTTKAPGYGMGLGVLLARKFAERLGGALVITSKPGKGTVARLEIEVGERTK